MASKKDVIINYTPQPKQMLFHKSAANELLYGGAAGPGKSMALRFEALIWCLRVPNLQVYLFRRTFPELEKNHILPSQQQFPSGVGEYKKGDKRWEFINGSMLHFCHCQYEQDVFQYQGAEIHLLLIDELTTFTEFQYDYLRGRVRCAIPVPEEYRHKIPGISCASNPGGVGHNYVKARWVDFAPPMTKKRASSLEGGMLREYIPGLLKDNQRLLEADPLYVHRLDALPEPYRTAYKDGNWDIFLGQAFIFSRKYHVIDPIPVPDNASIYMTYDWGYGAPFSIQWWWIDNDGRMIMFNEWYGWNGEPNKGLRLEDSVVAEGIIERERQFGRKPIVRLAGHDCWNKKPDYKGGGQGPSTAEVFAKYGLYLTKADSDRSLKIRAFRERLKIPENDRPMLQVYSTCEQFIRTIQEIQTDPKNPEYVDEKTGELHCFDSCCHLAMARPLSLQSPKELPTMAALYIDRLEKGSPADQYNREIRAELAMATRDLFAELDEDVVQVSDLKLMQTVNE